MIPIALSLIEAAGSMAPMIAGWLGGDKAEAIAHQVVNVAKAVTGQPSGDAALAAIQADPALSMQFQKALLDSRERMAQIAAELDKAELAAATTNAGNVNITMQAEGASDHWPTYSWRPAIGFAVAFDLVVSVILVAGVFLAVCIGAPGAAAAVAALPSTLGALAALVGLALPILGIASYWRGRMQADPSVQTDNRG